MRNYWTCSKFADWIRGTTKLKCGTGKEWREWEEAAKARYPIRWWIAEEGLDRIQDVWCYIPERINDVRYYVNNRWVTKAHALTAHSSDIPRGEWRDLGWRFLPCLFNELRDFVEVELAWWHIAWEGKKEREKYNPPFWATGWFRWRTWRCPQAGLDNLEWQMALTHDWLADDHPDRYKPSTQAENAREIFELYKWWTEVYPNRPDPYDAGGWSAFCEQHRQSGRDFLDFEDRTDEEREASSRALDLTQKIEEQYNQEEEEMMIRLIKIRQSLWT